MPRPHTPLLVVSPPDDDPRLGQALSDLHLGAAPPPPPAAAATSPFGAAPPADAPASAPARLTRAAARAAASASSSDADEPAAADGAGRAVRRAPSRLASRGSGGAGEGSGTATPVGDAAAATPAASAAAAVAALGSPDRKPRLASLAALTIGDDASAAPEPAAAALPPPRAPPASHLTAAALDASPSDVAVGLVYDPGMEAHAPPSPHVERPARTAALAALLAARGLAGRCRPIAPRAAADDELTRLHSPAHVAAVDAAYAARGAPYEDGDMYYCRATAHAARLAAGCVTQAVLAVLAGEARRAFAVVRPPGHHAACARAQGFCFFNNVALGAAAARAAGARRVLVVDFDVHHGDGIQALTYDTPDIMYVSLHRGGGFYPGTGAPVEVGGGAARGTNLNVAWTRGGLGDADYAAAFELVVMPVARAFAPDLVIVAAGFDAAAGDPLGGMLVSPAGFAAMAASLLTLAGGKMVMALEGGYNVDMTAACAAACVETLLGADAAAPDAAESAPRAGAPSRDAAPAIAAAATALAPHWPGALGPIADAAGFNRAWRDYCLKARKAGGGGAARVTRSAVRVGAE